MARCDEFGRELARRGIGLVYGGGRVGCMGALAQGALGANGEVIGVIPHALAGREMAHGGLTELRLVDTMHERKAAMAQLCDAFVALPGGYGTYEELFEVITWRQLGFHRKPIAVLDVDGYFAAFRDLIDRAVREGFVSAAERDAVPSFDTTAAVLEALVAACA